MVQSIQELDAKLKDPSLDSENHTKVERKKNDFPKLSFDLNACIMACVYSYRFSMYNTQ